MRFLFAAVLLCSCATSLGPRGYTQLVPAGGDLELRGAKIVSLMGPRGAVSEALERHLRQAGVRTQRFVSVGQGIPSSRYVIQIVGFRIAAQCAGGGHYYDFLDMELVDVIKNETVLTTHSAGYSDDCGPESGSLFASFASWMKRHWVDSVEQPRPDRQEI